MVVVMTVIVAVCDVSIGCDVGDGGGLVGDDRSGSSGGIVYSVSGVEVVMVMVCVIVEWL